MTNDEIQILSIPVRLRRAGREIRMLIDGTDPFAAVKPDARLIKLLVRAHRFNTTLVQSDGAAFANHPAVRWGSQCGAEIDARMWENVKRRPGHLR